MKSSTLGSPTYMCHSLIALHWSASLCLIPIYRSDRENRRRLHGTARSFLSQDRGGRPARWFLPRLFRLSSPFTDVETLCERIFMSRTAFLINIRLRWLALRGALTRPCGGSSTGGARGTAGTVSRGKLDSLGDGIREPIPYSLEPWCLCDSWCERSLMGVREIEAVQGPLEPYEPRRSEWEPNSLAWWPSDISQQRRE